MKEFGVDVDIYDPWADVLEVKHEYGLDIINKTLKLIKMKSRTKKLLAKITSLISPK